jgi:hypothetical protein
LKLSNNFHLDEFLVSDTAARNDIDMSPTLEVVNNLQKLVDTCLQPLRNHLGKVIHITSGYRPPALNSLIGGSVTSAHISGSAADLWAVGYTPLEVCEAIRDLDLPFDQNIHEFGRWTHIGIAENPRKELLTAYRKEGKTHYSWGLKKMEDLV